MLDPLSEARLAEVHPALAAKVRSMAEMLALENINIRVVQSLRSWAEQAALYAEGRDTEGNVVDKSKVVTNAKPGYSYHNLGLAIDVCPFEEGIPDWNSNHPVWKRIVAVGESVGLVSGSIWRTFPDWPHFQLTGRYPESPDDAVRSVFQSGGIDAVWNDSGLDTSISA
jgi:peptidoglycan L-alanyl-D-glutamate endopeptidase CwlK